MQSQGKSRLDGQSEHLFTSWVGLQTTSTQLQYGQVTQTGGPKRASFVKVLGISYCHMFVPHPATDC
jgi:hypothetical protein